MPRRFTRDAVEAPPPLARSGRPGRSVKLAVLVIYRDADGLFHWVGTGIRAARSRIASVTGQHVAGPALTEGCTSLGEVG